MNHSLESNPATPVRKGEELDWAALDAYLKRVLPGLEGNPRISQFSGGNSNLTYRLEYPGADLVVRRPPFGTKARSAHSMIREYRIMRDIRPWFGAVPETLAYSDDESIIGAEFYVMRKVPGQIVKREIPAHWNADEDDLRSLCTRFWEKLIELHQVDYRDAGLEDFGRPEGYVERQITGWNGRYERVITDDVGAYEDVRRWLEDHIPAESGVHAILHGDYRLDNVVLAEDDPTRIVALLDWEICAIGDPLMDLANSLAYWMQPGDPESLRAMSMQPSEEPGMLSRDEILQLYAERTGVDISNFGFYRVYGYWRIAVILQQIYFRYYHGQTADKRFSVFGQSVRALGEHCRGLIADT